MAVGCFFGDREMVIYRLYVDYIYIYIFIRFKLGFVRGICNYGFDSCDMGIM